MAEFLNLQPTADKYDAATTNAEGFTGPCTIGPSPGVRQILFSVIDEPCLALFWRYVADLDGKSELELVEREFVANTVGAVATGAGGVKFRSKIAGSPARIAAEMSFHGDVQIQGGAISPTAIGTQGQTVPGSTGTTGDIVYSAAATRSGALLCDGAAVSRTAYAALFAAIGTMWGAGDGSTTFNVPDLRDRVPVGAGGNTALAANEGVSAANRHGTRHRHTVNDPGHSHNYNEPLSGTGLGLVNSYGQLTPVATTTAATGISVGAGASDPLDGPAFAGLNAFILT